MRRPMHGGQDPQVGAADREHPAVEVLALELDRAGEARQDLRVGVVESCRRTRSIVKPVFERVAPVRRG